MTLPVAAGAFTAAYFVLKDTALEKVEETEIEELVARMPDFEVKEEVEIAREAKAHSEGLLQLSFCVFLI